MNPMLVVDRLGSVRRIVPLGTIPRTTDHNPLHHIDEPARVRPYPPSTSSANAVEAHTSTSPFWQSSTPRNAPSLITPRSTTPASPQPHQAKRLKKDQKRGSDEAGRRQEHGEGDKRVEGEKQVEVDKQVEEDERSSDRDADKDKDEQNQQIDKNTPEETNVRSINKDTDAQVDQQKTPTRATTNHITISRSERSLDDDTIEVARCAPAAQSLLDSPSSRMPQITFRSRASTKRKHVADDDVFDTDNDEELPSEMVERHGLMTMDDTELGGFGDDFDEEELGNKSDGDESSIVQNHGTTGKTTKSNKLAVSTSGFRKLSTSSTYILDLFAASQSNPESPRSTAPYGRRTMRGLPESPTSQERMLDHLNGRSREMRTLRSCGRYLFPSDSGHDGRLQKRDQASDQDCGG